MADLARVHEGLRLHAREGDLFVADLAALDAAQWELPTNCPPWLVRTLAAHVARQVESYIGNIEPGLRGGSVEPESREKRTARMNEIAAWETPAIIAMLRETNAHFNAWFGGLTPAQIEHRDTRHETAYARTVDGIVFELANTAAETTAWRDGELLFSAPRGVRVVTDRTGKVAALVGTSAADIEGTFRRPAGDIPFRIAANEQLDLRENGELVSVRRPGLVPPNY